MYRKEGLLSGLMYNTHVLVSYPDPHGYKVNDIPAPNYVYRKEGRVCYTVDPYLSVPQLSRILGYPALISARSI